MHSMQQGRGHSLSTSSPCSSSCTLAWNGPCHSTSLPRPVVSYPIHLFKSYALDIQDEWEACSCSSSDMPNCQSIHDPPSSLDDAEDLRTQQSFNAAQCLLLQQQQTEVHLQARPATPGTPVQSQQTPPRSSDATVPATARYPAVWTEYIYGSKHGRSNSSPVHAHYSMWGSPFPLDVQWQCQTPASLPAPEDAPDTSPNTQQQYSMANLVSSAADIDDSEVGIMHGGACAVVHVHAQGDVLTGTGSGLDMTAVGPNTIDQQPPWLVTLPRMSDISQDAQQQVQVQPNTSDDNISLDDTACASSQHCMLLCKQYRQHQYEQQCADASDSEGAGEEDVDTAEELQSCAERVYLNPLFSAYVNPLFSVDLSDTSVSVPSWHQRCKEQGHGGMLQARIAQMLQSQEALTEDLQYYQEALQEQQARCAELQQQLQDAERVTHAREDCSLLNADSSCQEQEQHMLLQRHMLAALQHASPGAFDIQQVYTICYDGLDLIGDVQRWGELHEQDFTTGLATCMLKQAMHLKVE